MRAALLLALCLALAACQPSASGDGGAVDAVSDPSEGDVPDGPAAGAAEADRPPQQEDADPASAGPEATAEADGDAPAEEAPPEPDIFAQARAVCEAEDGRFGRAPGGTEARICFRTPDDANQPCRTNADCEGPCLARSRTCAPILPLLGCHDVILSSGMRATECIQ